MYRYVVSLPDVLNCTPIRLTTLDGTVLLVPVDRVMAPGEVMEVKGSGFPINTSLPVNATKHQKDWAHENEPLPRKIYSL